jgi:hypothetical protein
MNLFFMVRQYAQVVTLASSQAAGDGAAVQIPAATLVLVLA